MEIHRRDFLKSVGMAGAGLVIINPALEAFATSTAKGKNPTPMDIGIWYPTSCQGCSTACPIEILVQSGRAVKVRGNQNSQVNPGTVCPRGHLQIQDMYDPDRLKTPLKRTNATKGKGVDPQFVPITWAAAMTEIATNILTLRNNGEAHKIGYMKGRGSGSTDLFYSAFTKIIGTPNKVSHSVLCAEAEKTGPLFMENKWHYRDYDLDNCKHLVLWGVDPTRANRQAPLFIKKYETIRKNGTITVIDPVLSSSAAKAHKWLTITPGTDGALASAIAHVLLTGGLWHKPFVGDWNATKGPFVANTQAIEADFTEVYTYGLVKWWNAELFDKTPTWASAITGIPAADIIQLATDMAAVAPNVSVWYGPGVAMQVRGAYSTMGVYALNALLGSWENAGGPLRSPSVAGIAALPTISTGNGYEDAIAATGLAQTRLDGSGTFAMPGINDTGIKGSAITNNFVMGMLDPARPYDLKMAIAVWCNFNHSAQGTTEWDQALAALPYFVHCTTNASEMSMFADIVLPVAYNSTEKMAFTTAAYNKHSECTIIQPLATRLWDVRTDENEIPYMLAEELNVQGFPNLLNYYKNEFKDPDTSAIATNYTEFAEYSTKFFTKTAYTTIGGWNAFKQVGVVTNNPPADKAHWGATGLPSNKFEFYSQKLKGLLMQHAADSPQKVMTVTLTGTSGTANINIGGVDYLATFTTDLTTTAANFKTTHSAALLLVGVTVKASAATIVLTAVAYGVDFAGLAPVNVTSDLAGTIATTVAINASPKWTGKTVDDVLIALNYPLTQGELAFVPHYEPPYRYGTVAQYPLTFVDRKSRFNREGRSQNLPFYYQFKKMDPGDENWSDVVLINPTDAAILGIVDGQTVTITSVVGNISCKAKLWEGLAPGTVAKTYGQGHWAYGRFASSVFGSTPNGGSNNQIMPRDFERMTGSSVRYGGFVGVKLT